MWKEQLPIVGMVSLEFIFAVMNLLNKKALVNGLSPMMLVLYKQAFGTLVTFPIAFLSSKGSSNARMDFNLFLLIFVSSFIGGSLYENLNMEGLYLTSSLVTSAMFNLVPAFTFLIATILRLEQVKMKELSHIAKVLGTIFCGGGAIAISFIKGPKLLNGQALLASHQHWLLGCLILLVDISCLSSWLIIQVPITKRYPNYLFLSAWTCLFSTIQTGIIALFRERDPHAWVLTSNLQLGACLFSGIFGTGAKFLIQLWCVSKRGPVFTATFSPLSTVLITFIGSLFLHEQLFLGSLIGASIVIVGLYVFLWGQAEEKKEKNEVDAHCTTTNLDHPLLTDV